MIPVCTGWVTDARRMIPGASFLDRIGDVALDGAFAIQRLSQRIHDTSQQALAHGHLQELARGADLVALFELGIVAQNDHADFGLFEVQRQAGNAVAEVEHFVEHHVGQAVHFGHAVADLADDAHIPSCRRRLGLCDLRFNFLY